ncbi:ligase-associated DNA damage response exonuclease [Oligoflexaceae bacterium]|nr:ligase-associated DNA damage response exonuclease [Oligoflexaceae bacterium]
MLEVTENGLYCPKGEFYIDPTGDVEQAVVTHGHADHAIQGSTQYWAHPATCRVMETRWKPGDYALQRLAYDETRKFGAVEVSLHPAGHILGSSQVKICDGKSTWVVSGDYNRGDDATCQAFEVQKCDVFVTESTFALPIFHWPPTSSVSQQIISWAEEKWSQGICTVLYAYSLGKTQRVLAALAAEGAAKFTLHSSAHRISKVYEEFGVDLPEYDLFDKEMNPSDLVGSFVILPPAMERSHFMRRKDLVSAAFLSGWMQLRGMRRRRNIEKGFVLSDHADWSSLIETIKATGAKKVYTTHGYSDVLSKYLETSVGICSEELTILRDREEDQ